MSDIKFTDGGICAPKGFKANGVHCGIRKNREKPDLALICSEKPCSAAGVYTQNLVCGAPVTLTKRNLENGVAQAVICNSGIANTCMADGMDKAQRMCDIAASILNIDSSDVIVASTGVIGQPLPIEPIENAAKTLFEGLSEDGSDRAANAIMTTDTVKKEFAVEFVLDSRICRIGAISKGSGMINPNMATMLCFSTSDVNISSAMLKKALTYAAGESFNMLSVDGDTSTNDTFTVMANGLAGNKLIESENEDYLVFRDALTALCIEVTKKMAADGEGATKLLICDIKGAADDKTAKALALSVINSAIVKTAMFGADANWGRVLCALGYAGVSADVNKIDVSFCSAAGEIKVCENGAGIEFSEETAKRILLEKEITINVTMGDGQGKAQAFGCDLSYDYVRINGDYRT